MKMQLTHLSYSLGLGAMILAGIQLSMAQTIVAVGSQVRGRLFCVNLANLGLAKGSKIRSARGELLLLFTG